MSRKPPRNNTSAHWALYLMAAYESDNLDEPRATVDDLWSDTQAPDVFDTKHDLKKSLRKVYDREVPTVSDYEYSYLIRTNRTRPYEYQLTDVGKRTIQRLEHPDATPDGTPVTTSRDRVPIAAYRETGLGEPDGRSRMPRLPSPEQNGNRVDTPVEPDADDAPTDMLPLGSGLPQTVDEDEQAIEPFDSDLLVSQDPRPTEHVFVDAQPTEDGTRHMYVPYEDGSETLIPKCGLAEFTETSDELAFTELGEFERADDACEHCLSSSELVPAPAGGNRRDLLPEADTTGRLESGDTLPTVPVEPDWRWLAVSLANAGHTDLAQRVARGDITPTELYGDVLKALYDERDALADAAAFGSD